MNFFIRSNIHHSRELRFHILGNLFLSCVLRFTVHRRREVDQNNSSGVPEHYLHAIQFAQGGRYFIDVWRYMDTSNYERFPRRWLPLHPVNHLTWACDFARNSKNIQPGFWGHNVRFARSTSFDVDDAVYVAAVARRIVFSRFVHCSR